jgi:hypothetical protein
MAETFPEGTLYLRAIIIPLHIMILLNFLQKSRLKLMRMMKIHVAFVAVPRSPNVRFIDRASAVAAFGTCIRTVSRTG